MSYTWGDCLNPIGGNIGNWISPSEIENIRCDGLVEYCYEWKNFDVWGKNGSHYDVSSVNYYAEHNNLYDKIWPNNPDVELAPVVQRGAAGGSSTHMTWSAITDLPTYEIEESQIGSTVYVTITATDQSGIHYIKYKKGSGGSYSSSPVQPQHPTSASYSYTVPVTSSTWLYYYAKDNGGNYPDYAESVWVEVTTFSTTTIGYSSSSTTTIGYSSSSSSTTTIGSSSSSTTTVGYSSSSTTTIGYSSSSTTTVGYSSSSTTTSGTTTAASSSTTTSGSSTTTFQSTSTIPGTTALSFSNSRVDDDSLGNSSGNNNGVIDPGETIELYVTLKNTGSADATGVTAELSTGDPYVGAFLFNTSSSYPDIPDGGTGENTDDFDFPVDPSCPLGHVITFDLVITSNEGSWTDSFKIVAGRSPAIMPWLQLLLLGD